MNPILDNWLAVGASLIAFAADLPDDAKAVQGNWKPVKDLVTYNRKKE